MTDEELRKRLARIEWKATLANKKAGFAAAVARAMAQKMEAFAGEEGEATFRAYSVAALAALDKTFIDTLNEEDAQLLREAGLAHLPSDN